MWISCTSRWDGGGASSLQAGLTPVDYAAMSGSYRIQTLLSTTHKAAQLAAGVRRRLKLKNTAESRR